jgi:hypothetical protein
MWMTENGNSKKLNLKLAQNLEGAEGWSTGCGICFPSEGHHVGRK